MKTFPIIYKKTKKDQIQQWQIIVNHDSFYTIEGIVNGKLTQGTPTKCKAKNVGKANETTPEQQALLEAQSKFDFKLNQGYSETVETSGKKFFEPMLAQEYKKDNSLLFKVKTFIQPKLDGVRCISAENSLTSRNGKAFFNCNHLYQSDFTFDGELYNHDFRDNFNKIISLVKKQKVTDASLQEAKQYIKYFVYDFPEIQEKFSVRYQKLKEILSSNKYVNYELVPTFEVSSFDDVEKYHDEFLSQGYEGSIIRLDLGPYDNKRSKQLLKKKDFNDDEFEIIDVIEGEGARTGTVGAFVCQDKEGKIFKSNIKGTFEYLSSLLAQKQNLIGKLATIKYFNLTPDGIPRFPYVIKIDRLSIE